MRVEDRYPTKKARDAADKVVEEMPESLTMAEFLAAWDAAYVAAGGRVVL